MVFSNRFIVVVCLRNGVFSTTVRGGMGKNYASSNYSGNLLLTYKV